MTTSDLGTVFQFLDFRLDCARFELLRRGHPVRMERKPLELLILLASREGQLVTREEIAERLWSKEVFVDTEHGINTAVRKIRTALRDDPENPRYVQTVTGMGYRLLAPVVRIQAPLKELTPSRGSSAEPEAVLGAPIHTRGPWSLLRTILAISTGLAIVVLSITISRHVLAGRRGDQRPVTSIAVLPLADFSGDPGQAYFADGMTDELITMLARDSTLHITSRTSVMEYKGASRPLPEIASKLHVDGILEGSVSRSRDRVHMNLQLIRAETDTHLWAQSYDSDTADAVALPDRAARAIAARLKSTAASVPPMPHIRSDAHDEYLQGHFYFFGDNYPECAAHMQKAIDLQSDYADAWAGLADCFGAAAASGKASPSDASEKEYAAAMRALQLDSNSAEAHHALAAYYLFHSWNPREAEVESRKAIALNPDWAEFHHLYCYILRAEGRDEESLNEQKRAIELDPYSRPWALGSEYTSLRQYDAAIAELEARASSHQQNYWLRMELARAYWLSGAKEQWVEQMRLAYLTVGDTASAEAIQHAYASGGAGAVGKWSLKRDLKRERTQFVSPLLIAEDYAYLNDKEQTLQALEVAVQARTPWLVFLKKLPEFDFVSRDKRYLDIVRQIELPQDSQE